MRADAEEPRARADAAAPGVRTDAVGVVVPVRNEEHHLPSALAALDVARDRLTAAGVVSHIVVVLDDCSDRSAAVARRWQQRNGRDSSVVAVAHGNVGRTRHGGISRVLARFADVPTDRLWLATTDADSEVPPGWLTGQLAHRAAGADVWTGRVTVRDGAGVRAAMIRRWRTVYAAEAVPVHGASLGLSASAYLAVGGFAPVRTGEDRALVEAVLATGARGAHGGDPVLTSARVEARAPLGFAHALTHGLVGGAETVPGMATVGRPVPGRLVSAD